MEKIILLDNGHGGIIDGVYQTKGKRSPRWKDGSILYEGEFNRAIVRGISKKLDELEIKHINLVPEEEDISLHERINRANKYAKDYNAFYLSIHSNAGGGHGWEAYTSIGETKSDKFVDILYQEAEASFPNRTIRSDYSDGDVDKESNFYVLRKTLMPAVLTENFFMDNENECKGILMTKYGRHQVITLHVKAILRILEIM